MPEEMLSMDEVFLKRLTETVEAHLKDSTFGVDELASEMALSRSQLHRKLQTIAGQSASRFIRTVKLRKAREMLERRVARVSEISDQLGFSSPSYFCQVFAEEFGFPPREIGRTEDPVKPPPLQKKPMGRRLVMLVFVLILCTTGGILYYSIHPDDPPRSIAVLPFTNMGPEDQEYFSDGITEDIIGQLARIPGIMVISRTSVMLYKDSKKNLKEIAEELNVSTVLEGSVRRSGNRVRIVAQLIDAQNDIHLWSETYDRKLNEFLTIQGDVAREIASTLRVKMKTEKRNEDYLSTVDPEVYDLYSKARFLEHQFSREVTYTGIRLYEKCLQIDPTFGPAYAGLASCYEALASWYAVISPEDAMQHIRPNLDKALVLAPDLFQTHSVTAYANFFMKWDFEGAEKSFKRAIKLNPSDIMTRSGYHYLLNILGRHEDALAEWTDYILYDPVSWWSNAFNGQTLLLAGDTLAAIAHQNKMLANNPNHIVIYAASGWVFFNGGQWQRSIEVYEEGMHKFKIRPPSMLCHLALAYLRQGNTERAANLIAEVKKLYENDQPNTAAWIGMYYSGLNDKEAAFEWLEKAYEAHDVDMIWLKMDPEYRSLQDDLRYEDLLRRIGF